MTTKNTMVFFGERFLANDGGGVFRSGFLVSGIWYLRVGWGFVVVVEVEKEDLELVVECVMKLVWAYLNRRTHFLCHLSLMLVEADVPSVDGYLFRMVMQANFVSLLLFLDGDCLRKMIGVKVEMWWSRWL